MQLENQFCTLEQSKKLTALGIENISLFKFGVNAYDPKCISLSMSPDSRDTIYPAFSVAEMIVMIGEDFAHMENLPSFLARDNFSEFLIYYLSLKRLTASDCNERLKNA